MSQPLALVGGVDTVYKQIKDMREMFWNLWLHAVYLGHDITATALYR